MYPCQHSLHISVKIITFPGVTINSEHSFSVFDTVNWAIGLGKNSASAVPQSSALGDLETELLLLQV